MTLDELFETYPNLIFYDFEVFPKYWCVVVCTKDEYFKLLSTQKEVESFVEKHKNHIWCGYNNRHYDKWILSYIYDLWDSVPENDRFESLFNLSQKIVDGEKPGISLCERFEQQYDCMVGLQPLKRLEGYMGKSIEESKIQFDYPDEFTPEMIEETYQYCRHDVEMTIEVFKRTLADFEAQKQLIETFGLDKKAWSFTKAQLTATVLKCNKNNTLGREEWEGKVFPFIPDRIKNKDVLDFYSTDSYHQFINGEAPKFKKNIAGCEHVFALGGVHAGLKKFYKKGSLRHVDVNSYYPSIMIKHNKMSRASAEPKLYEEIYNKRLQLKAEGKDAEQAPYKIVLNSTYGILNQKMSKAYDPKHAHEICINGQLMLLLLVEMTEGYCKLVQSNTDGLIVDLDGYDENQFKKICKEWCDLTQMTLGFETIDEIWQKDVNNYIFHFADIESNGRKRNKYECKGAYTKHNKDLDNDMPIVQEAVRNACIKGGNSWSKAELAIEDTINLCTNFISFQKLITRSAKSYDYFWWRNKPYINKVYRVFASSDEKDTDIRKQRHIDSNKEKIANTPERCRLYNGELPKYISSWIDKEYYIDMAKKRAKEMIEWEI